MYFRAKPPINPLQNTTELTGFDEGPPSAHGANETLKKALKDYIEKSTERDNVIRKRCVPQYI